MYQMNLLSAHVNNLNCYFDDMKINLMNIQDSHFIHEFVMDPFLKNLVSEKSSVSVDFKYLNFPENLT